MSPRSTRARTSRSVVSARFPADLQLNHHREAEGPNFRPHGSQEHSFDRGRKVLPEFTPFHDLSERLARFAADILRQQVDHAGKRDSGLEHPARRLDGAEGMSFLDLVSQP